jgi:nucleotide-binding universal stress UspA family protein
MASESSPDNRRVLCLVDVGTEADDLGLRLGQRLAQALEARLDAQPAPRRAAVEGLPQADSATVVVAPTEPRTLAALWQPARSPVLAERVGAPTVLIPERAAASHALSSRGELVCGVDRSRGARSAARVASTLAERLGVPLSLVHAQAPVPAVALAPGGGAAGLPHPVMEEENREAGWELLEAIDSITPERARLRLRRGQPAKCLDEYAALHDAPLIVVGAPEHGRLSSLLLGSTAWDLYKLATTPVMYVPEGLSWTP